MLNQSNLGCMNFNVLRTILTEEDILDKQIGAEVGVLHGQTSHYLLSELPELTLISIDPWLAYIEIKGERTQDEMDNYESITRKRLAPYGKRSVIIKSTSIDVAMGMKDECLDFVFIDANHSFEEVSQDLIAWYPKVRQGGLFAGHDYSWDGVQRAVDGFSDNNLIDGFYSPNTSDIWYFIKPGGAAKSKVKYII